MTTFLAQLRRLAPVHVRVTNDPGMGAYLASTDLGYRFEGGLHEYVADYSQDLSFRAEAREAIAEDLASAKVEECPDAECEWCYLQ